MRAPAATVFFIVLAVAGCKPSPAGSAVPPPARRQGSESLGPGDLLDIRVRQQEDLSGMYRVDDDGSVRFPYIGVVKVSGRLPVAIAEEIEVRLADGYLREPQVAVLVHEHQNREVSVLGQVHEPGSYPYKERLTLVQAISLAGGMNPLAHPRRVKLIRETDEGRKTFEIDVGRILESRAEDLPLEPGDIVFIPESPI